MSKKKKEKYIDDGHTIYSMDVDAKWSKQKSEKSVYVSKEEKRALIKAAYRSYLPKVLLIIASFGLAMVLIYFWLK